MRQILFLVMLVIIVMPARADEDLTGVRGDPEAIADAQAMVEQMGGMDVWANIKSLHFVHEWFPYNRVDPYLEHEILDLTGPRSWVSMESEGFYRVRAYSPEHKYWVLLNGELSHGSEQALASSLSRAPYSIYRIARAVAVGDPYYEIRLGDGDIQGSRQLEFYGPDGELYGWIILNARKQPIVWATREYRYIFGPLKQYGDVKVADWAVYGNGPISYQMVSLEAGTEAPDLALFAVPEEFRE